MAIEAPPLPSENNHWPSWFYPPEVAEDDTSMVGRIFRSADEVPDGWVLPSYIKIIPAKPEPDETQVRLSRQDLCRALDELGEVYKPNAGYAALKKQLDEAVAVLQADSDAEMGHASE